MTSLRLATRRSPLALAQSHSIAERIEAATGRDVELVPITSDGDRSTASLRQIGGIGVFVATVRDAVVAGRADFAVHSLKDLPTAAHEGLELAAVPPRGDVRDALVSLNGGLADLAPGASIGTGSPRRAAQLRSLRPDVRVIDIRGNVDTRIGMVDSGEMGAIVLALAGLQRLGRENRATQVLSVAEMLPAPGQAALAIESRADDVETKAAVVHLSDPTTYACVTAERALLHELQAGCTAPVAALATITGEGLELEAAVWGDGSPEPIRVSISGATSDPAHLGRTAAQQLLADGAAQLVGEPVR